MKHGARTRSTGVNAISHGQLDDHAGHEGQHPDRGDSINGDPAGIGGVDPVDRRSPAPASEGRDRRAWPRRTPERLAADARATFHRLYDREIGDEESEEMRGNLLAFFAILRRWHETQEGSTSAAVTLPHDTHTHD